MSGSLMRRMADAAEMGRTCFFSGGSMSSVKYPMASSSGSATMVLSISLLGVMMVNMPDSRRCLIR